MELSTLPLDFKPTLSTQPRKAKKKRVLEPWVESARQKRMLHSTVGDHVVCPGELL